MKPSAIEAIGIAAVVSGSACLVTAAWMLGGLAIAFLVAGVLAMLGGYVTVRAAASIERKAP